MAGAADKPRLEFTPEAIGDLRWLRKHEQRLIVDQIQALLQTEPTVESRHRKPLRPNDLATWELRIGKFRVFYDIGDAATVKIKAVAWKEHNTLFIRGQEYQL